MFAASFLTGAAACLFFHIPFPCWLLPIAVGAAAGAATELLSPSAYDTITVPTIILIVLLIVGL